MEQLFVEFGDDIFKSLQIRSIGWCYALLWWYVSISNCIWSSSLFMCFPFLSVCRYRFQGTQTHIGSMFQELCWALRISTTKFIMCCYFRGNIGWKYVGIAWIYVQGWSACVTGGTQQLLESSWKPSGKLLNYIFSSFDWENWQFNLIN